MRRFGSIVVGLSSVVALTVATPIVTGTHRGYASELRATPVASFGAGPELRVSGARGNIGKTTTEECASCASEYIATHEPYFWYSSIDCEECEDGYSASGPCRKCADNNFCSLDCLEDWFLANPCLLAAECWIDPRLIASAEFAMQMGDWAGLMFVMDEHHARARLAGRTGLNAAGCGSSYGKVFFTFAAG